MTCVTNGIFSARRVSVRLERTIDFSPTFFFVLFIYFFKTFADLSFWNPASCSNHLLVFSHSRSYPDGRLARFLSDVNQGLIYHPKPWDLCGVRNRLPPVTFDTTKTGFAFQDGLAKWNRLLINFLYNFIGNSLRFSSTPVNHCTLAQGGLFGHLEVITSESVLPPSRHFAVWL